MKIIFCESTLQKEELNSSIREQWLFMPSIRRGDIISLLNNDKKPEQILIVDGLFEHVTSITHKEILLAINENIKVVGVSSMGALRACELYPYGMFGSGDIFEDYLSKKIESDEEVAVSFVKRKGEVYSTLPLVNIRKTVEKNDLDHEILSISKDIFYKDRTWERLKSNLSTEQYFQLRKLYQDQKKIDVLNYLYGESSLLTANNPLYNVANNSFIINEIVKHKYGGALLFLRGSLLKKSKTDIQKGRIPWYLANFIGAEETAGAIADIFSEEKYLHVTIINNKQFNQNILRELGISNKEDLKEYIKSKNIPINILEEIFMKLYILYKVLSNNQKEVWP